MNVYHGKRVVIIGAARQGTALARYMVKQGARVTINDRQNAQQLQDAVSSLAGYPIEWVLADHPISLLDNTDFLFVSGGVPLNLPVVKTAMEIGIPVSNDSQVFMDAVKAPVVGITGSAGKTTTTTLFGRIAQAECKPPRKAWVGGNIGNPLVEYVDEIAEQDLVIQELSSFQLDLMTSSPQISAILNITPNHLDRHADMADYIRAKAHIITFQKPDDIAVLNHEDREAWNLRNLVQGRMISFGLTPVAGEHAQVYVNSGFIVAASGTTVTTLLDTSLIELRGSHNLMNVIAACSLAFALGFNPASIAAGVKGFTGVKHREQLVRVVDGVSWINDSIATAPERTLAAIKAFTEPIVLLLGGRDKNLPWQELASVIHQRVDHVVLFSEAAEKIAQAIGKPAPGDRLESVIRTHSLVEALEESRRLAVSGDVVLLSPGCTSYDAFKDFEERGELFIDWVNAL
jgi:UDP-N-acetylmuramoylalanine--D-glutamate ligase